MLRTILKHWQQIHQLYRAIKTNNSFFTPYKIKNIERNSQEHYIVVVQIVNKGISFKTKPELLLADDNMVRQFSPYDVRTLTYLGYSNNQSPKYKVIATRQSRKLKKMLFALQQKDKKEPTFKTAHQISKNEKILSHLSQKDAHMIGYVTGSEQALQDFLEIKRQKQQAKTRLILQELAKTAISANDISAH